MRSPSELTETFRERGLKLTPQRQLLFRLLHDNTAHPTADALYAVAAEQMPGISLRTVYQTLTDLTSMGELRSFDFGGAMRFDPNVHHHHHVLCRRCGVVADVEVDAAALRVSDLDGFTVERADVVFRGVCGACASPSSSPT